VIARKNPSTGKWDAQYSYTDWQGKRKKTTKRGFRTKREAVEWYDHFRATQDADFNMVFKDFIEIYMGMPYEQYPQPRRRNCNR